MEQIGGENVGQRTSTRKVVAASLVGNAVDWHDFFLCGTAAALVFNEVGRRGSQGESGRPKGKKLTSRNADKLTASNRREER